MNISIDTLIPDKFAKITRRDKKGLSLLLANIAKGMLYLEQLFW